MVLQLAVSFDDSANRWAPTLDELKLGTTENLRIALITKIGMCQIEGHFEIIILGLTNYLNCLLVFGVQAAKQI